MARIWDYRAINLTPEEQSAFMLANNMAVSTTKLVTATLLQVCVAAFVAWLVHPMLAWLAAGLVLVFKWILLYRGEGIIGSKWQDHCLGRIKEAEDEVKEVERQLAELQEPFVSSFTDGDIMELEQRDWDHYKRTRKALRAARHLAYARLGDYTMRLEWAGRSSKAKP